MTFKVVQNPKTGKMETVPDVPKATPESLGQLHKEVRDMLDGNTQFHVDPLAKPAPPSTTIDPQEDDDFLFDWVVF